MRSHHQSGVPPVKERGMKPMRILLVEDNPTNQFVALKMLEKLGYNADTADNGLEAITALETAAYDLVLMDCQMPELDGFEATRRIRAGAGSALNQHVPIVAMTANALQGDREQCIDAGMNDYISKPVDQGLLAQTLARWAPATSDGGTEMVQERIKGDAPIVWDRKGFLVRVMGDEELLKAVVSEFLKDVPNQLALLSNAVRDGDRATIKGIAHRIKGSSANVGGLELQNISARLQEEALQGPEETIRTLARQIEEEFQRIKEVMMT
jgi:CheY-like chemotaxis protein/HPt (histidine-containing phosphotransfer) domain-containing protein